MNGPASIPATAHDVADLLAEAARNRTRVVPVGAGTKVAWHHDPAPTAARLSTLGLTDGFLHDAGDLVATLPAGMTLADANARLALAGQWLPLDPSSDKRSTIGGLIAANASGPRRHRFGTPRDLIVGIEVALTDGRVVKAGGRVVKNVAGYDLSRLFCGSHGSLGVVTSATFKLAPIAFDSRTLVLQFPTLALALDSARALVHSDVTPSALELQGPDARLLVRFETTARASAAMADAARAHVGQMASTANIVGGDDEAALWHEHEARLTATEDETVVKVTTLPTRAPLILEGLGNAPLRAISGAAALGVLALRFRGEASAVVSAVDALHRRVLSQQGHLSVRHAPPAVREHLPPPPPAPASAVMHAVKRCFDPNGVLRRVPDGR
ncbi:MAG: FAD-binding oxidoreductase [Vicinamibacterales bacterium]